MTVFPESSVIDMKRIVSIALVPAMLLLLLVSCSEKIVKMEYNEDGALEARDGSLYKYAPVGYEPTNQGEEYGLIESALSEKLYRIGEEDPSEWLTTEYTGATTTVYYSADIELPTLSEMEPTLCYICEQDENIYSVYTLGDGNNKDADAEVKIIDDIVNILEDDSIETAVWPRGDGAETYNLKMYSENWPAIYYNIVYVREGSSNYIYDRCNKKCVNVGDLLESFFEDAE